MISAPKWIDHDLCDISAALEGPVTRDCQIERNGTVVGELPAEFRIGREIIGDPLADMPKLLPNPPNFEPVGRYTAERKEKICYVFQQFRVIWL